MASLTTVGDKVKLKNNLIGTVRFIGEIGGKKGVFYGVELNEEKGKNNGSVGKISYFKCKPKRGLFVKETSIIKTNSKNNVKTPRVSVGHKIKYTKGKSNGIIRFIGTPYAIKKSGIYYGIELEKPKGSNNGTVKGTKYFKCKSKYGIFLQSGEFSYHEQKLIKTTPSRSTPKGSKKKNGSKKGKKTAKDIVQKQNDETHTINKQTEIADDEADEHKDTEVDHKQEETEHKEMDQKKILDEITDDDHDVVRKQIMFEEIKKDEKSLFDVMENTMKRLKELMVTKDAEIDHHKKMYQELKEKNQEEMHYMKVLLEEQKCNNRMLMGKMKVLEEGTISKRKNEENKGMKDDNVIENHIPVMKGNADDTKGNQRECLKNRVISGDEMEMQRIIWKCRESYSGDENGNKDTEQQRKSKRVPEEYTKSENKEKDDENKEDTNDQAVYKMITKDRECLVYGYVRKEQKLLNETIVVPIRIMDICYMYYSFKEILRNMYSKYIEIIEGGTRVKSVGIENVNICCVSNEGFSEGIHMFSVECMDIPRERGVDFCGVGHAVGIASKYDTDCEFDNLEDAIYYDGYWGIVMNCVGKHTQFKKTKWSKGDVIKIMLNCDEWKITFCKNDEEIGTWSVREKKKYYLVMQLNSMEGYDYKILEYY